MFSIILFLLLGFAILIVGAELLVRGASSTARRYGISDLAIGLTVVAFGTSMPELVVSLMAALQGKNDASFGNVIGSNNFNLLFILGVSGIICPLVVHKNSIRYEIPLSLVAAAVLFFLVNDGMYHNAPDILSVGDSIALLLLFALFLLYIYRTMAVAPGIDNPAEKGKVYSLGLSVLMIAAGLAMLIGGGELVVDNAISIAQKFGVSERIIGLTILAAGTSLPELAASSVAAYRGNTDIAVGNVIGSNIFNILFILGITGLVSPIPYNTRMNQDIYLLLGGTGVLMIFMFTMKQHKLDRWEAFMLLVGYIVYTIYLVCAD